DARRYVPGRERKLIAAGPAGPGRPGRPSRPGRSGRPGKRTVRVIDMSSKEEQAGEGAGGEAWPKQLDALGRFIRAQRRLAHMSLREMAALTSVSNAYLSQIERGLHQPSLRVLRSIAQALSIAPEELLRRANFIPASSGA